MMSHMVIVRGTRKFLARLPGPPLSDGEKSTTMLPDWYATVLPWRPHQAALLVSETTLLPVMLRMAPSATVLERSRPSWLLFFAAIASTRKPPLRNVARASTTG